MNKQWNELKSTITDMRDNYGTGTQREVCGFLVKLMNRLEKQMSDSEKANKWIPISERLPEDKTYVLTTIKVPNRIAHARSGWYEDGFFYNDNGDIWKATDMEVIAWMPLPLPYTAESEDENE